MSRQRNAEIARAYRAGATAAQLAARYGVSGSRIYVILEAQGVERRSVGRRPGTPPAHCRAVYAPDGSPLADSMVAAARRLGVSIGAIGHASIETADGGRRLRYLPTPRRRAGAASRERTKEPQ